MSQPAKKFKRASTSRGKTRPTTRRAPRLRRQPSKKNPWHLTLTDGDPIRQKTKREYERTQCELAKARGDLDRFHKKDVPRFAQWLNSNFGTLLTDLRELSRRAADAEQLVFEVENEVFFTGESYGTVYRRIVRRRERLRDAPEDGPTDNEAKDKTFRDEDDDFDPFDILEEILKEKEAREAEFNQGFRDGPESQRRPSGRSSQKVTNESRLLKELYRTLVRRLHPDCAGNLTDHQRELWHQVQTAYEAGDVEQLEVILALQQVDDRGSTENTSVSLLQKITLRFRAALKDLRAQLRKLRKDPAWKFSDRRDLTALHRQFQRTLQRDVMKIRAAVEHFESLLEQWEHEKKPRRSRRRQRNPFNDDFGIPF